MTQRVFYKGSDDFLETPVVDRNGEDLTDSIDVAFSIDGTETWEAAAWTGAAASTRTAQLWLVTDEMAVGNYHLHVKLGETIEHAGVFQVKDPLT